MDLAESPWTDAEEERAAIFEYEAHFSREWAEALARLDATATPKGIPSKRWRQFVDDAFAFTRAGWAYQAAVLGWQAVDLVGCDRLRPFERIDRAGLLWLLNGAELLALTETTAVVETASGARQSYHRREEHADARMLAWDLDGR